MNHAQTQTKQTLADYLPSVSNSEFGKIKNSDVAYLFGFDHGLGDKFLDNLDEKFDTDKQWEEIVAGRADLKVKNEDEPSETDKSTEAPQYNTEHHIENPRTDSLSDNSESTSNKNFKEPGTEYTSNKYFKDPKTEYKTENPRTEYTSNKYYKDPKTKYKTYEYIENPRTEQSSEKRRSEPKSKTSWYMDMAKKGVMAAGVIAGAAAVASNMASRPSKRMIVPGQPCSIPDREERERMIAARRGAHMGKGWSDMYDVMFRRKPGESGGKYVKTVYLPGIDHAQITDNNFKSDMRILKRLVARPNQPQQWYEGTQDDVFVHQGGKSDSIVSTVMKPVVTTGAAAATLVGARKVIANGEPGTRTREPDDREKGRIVGVRRGMITGSYWSDFYDVYFRDKHSDAWYVKCVHISGAPHRKFDHGSFTKDIAVLESVLDNPVYIREWFNGTQEAMYKAGNTSLRFGTPDLSSVFQTIADGRGVLATYGESVATATLVTFFTSFLYILLQPLTPTQKLRLFENGNGTSGMVWLLKRMTGTVRDNPDMPGEAFGDDFPWWIRAISRLGNTSNLMFAVVKVMVSAMGWSVPTHMLQTAMTYMMPDTDYKVLRVANRSKVMLVQMLTVGLKDTPNRLHTDWLYYLSVCGWIVFSASLSGTAIVKSLSSLGSWFRKQTDTSSVSVKFKTVVDEARETIAGYPEEDPADHPGETIVGRDGKLYVSRHI